MTANDWIFVRLRSTVVALVTAAALATGIPTQQSPTTEEPADAVVAASEVELAAATVGHTRQARTGRQRASMKMLPPIAATSRRPQPAGAARNIVVASFKPGVRGRPVALQRRQGRRWVTIKRARQSRAGLVEFTAPSRFRGRVATYRALSTGKGRPRSATAGVRTDVRELSFSDEFSGRQLDRSVWATRAQGFSRASQRKCSEADDRAVGVRRGTLRLSVRNHPDFRRKCRVDGRRYERRINGHIGTEGTMERKYGFFAARIKFQPRRGQHGAFWMQTTVGGGGAARTDGAEIDVIEWFGNNQPQGGLTSFVYADGRKIGGFLRNPARFGRNWAGKYHVFSVEWTPRRYTFRIDGKTTFTTRRGVSRVPEYLILSLLSSDYELKYLGGERRLPQTMHVDWVRHWRL